LLEKPAVRAGAKGGVEAAGEGAQCVLGISCISCDWHPHEPMTICGDGQGRVHFPALSSRQPLIVSEMLGHASVAFTLQTYGHVQAEMRKPVRDSMERLFGGVFRR
jgi:hypothetical protein